MVGPLGNFILRIILTWLKLSFQIAEIVHLVQSSDHMAFEGLVVGNDEHSDPDEEPNATTNMNDMECKNIHLVEAHVSAE